jgi:2-oxoglutarate/2-oxoacid ferredoxin oxidoreductase subunit beta
MNQIVETTRLTQKDFASSDDVRWCPGCGDYGILSSVHKLMPELGIPKERIVWVSGIGCSSRFPYYVDTYGFHTIHGRAPAIALGIKAADPELSVWIATGDGDGLSIGGNHLFHCLRRNLDVKILLFNNRIYGLTKGQYSPTSELGKHTYSSPFGSADRPVDPIRFALGCGATFVARSYDTAGPQLLDVLRRAAAHRGTAFVEILQNCHVFNDAAFDAVTNKATAASHQLRLEHGKPMLFGEDRSQGLALDHSALKLCRVENVGTNGTTDSVLVHDESNAVMAHLLASLESPEFPVPLGVLSAISLPTYEDQLRNTQSTAKGTGGLQALLNSGQVWQVSNPPAKADAQSASSWPIERSSVS